MTRIILIEWSDVQASVVFRKRAKRMQSVALIVERIIVSFRETECPSLIRLGDIDPTLAVCGVLSHGLFPSSHGHGRNFSATTRSLWF